MARAKSNTRSKSKTTRGKGNYSFWQLNIIILFLVLQNSYLIYANFDSIEGYLQVETSTGLSSLMGFSEKGTAENVSIVQSSLQDGTSATTSTGDVKKKRRSDSQLKNGSDPKKASVKKKDRNSPVRVQILNGCRVGGIAARWKKNLRKKKYDVRDTGNNPKSISRSTVVSRISDMSCAYELAGKLGISRTNVIQQLNRNIVDIDVTLIIGKDYTRLKTDWK